MGLEQFIAEEHVRARSYAIWVAEGRPEGRCEDHWYRALAELEKELVHTWLMALEEREYAEEMVMPRPPISQPVHRRLADRIDPGTLRRAA